MRRMLAHFAASAPRHVATGRRRHEGMPASPHAPPWLTRRHTISRHAGIYGFDARCHGKSWPPCHARAPASTSATNINTHALCSRGAGFRLILPRRDSRRAVRVSGTPRRAPLKKAGFGSAAEEAITSRRFGGAARGSLAAMMMRFDNEAMNTEGIRASRARLTASFLE